MSGNQLDTLDQILAAYGRRSSAKLRAQPETAGLAVALLVNRNTAPDRILRRWDDDGQRGSPERMDHVLCSLAEAFAEGLGAPHTPGWRGGGMAGLRRLLGAALHDTTAPLGVTATIWLDQDPATTTVTAWLAEHGHNSPRIAAAVDALVAEFWETNHAAALASYCNLFERPGATVRLRAKLTGLPVVRAA